MTQPNETEYMPESGGAAHSLVPAGADRSWFSLGECNRGGLDGLAPAPLKLHGVV